MFPFLIRTECNGVWVGQLSQVVYDRLSRHRSCTIKILIYHRDLFTIHFILKKKKKKKKKKERKKEKKNIFANYF